MQESEFLKIISRLAGVDPRVVIPIGDDLGAIRLDQMSKTGVGGTGVPPVLLNQNKRPTNSGIPYDNHVHERTRNLPHWELAGSTYFVTFRVGDGDLSETERGMVLASCLHWHGSRARMHAVVVMKDHVHCLVTPLKQVDESVVTLASLLHSIKSFTSHEIGKQRGTQGTIWQEEYFDRIVRDHAEFVEKLNYIIKNPMTAGLVSKPDEYRFLVVNDVDGGQSIKEHGRDARATMDSAQTPSGGTGVGVLGVGGTGVGGTGVSGTGVPPVLLIQDQFTDLLLVGIDQVLEGVHFDLDLHTPAQAARKAVMRNMSDCAAMACVPVAIVASLALPKSADGVVAIEIYHAMRDCAHEFGCVLLGGDTSVWAGPLAMSVAVVGRANGIAPVRRSGAKPGDRLYVTGPLGGSILERHMNIIPRIKLARDLASRYEIHAMMDLSDGLSRDLPRLCDASNVGAIIDADQVPIHSDVAKLNSASDPIDHALHDGEDYELLFASPSHEALRNDPRVACIGEIVAEQGVRIIRNGVTSLLEPKGWDHAMGDTEGSK